MVRSSPQERDFFFEAEDGIRDSSVTGVQTCDFRFVPVVLTREDHNSWNLSRRPRYSQVPSQPLFLIPAVAIKSSSFAFREPWSRFPAPLSSSCPTYAPRRTFAFQEPTSGSLRRAHPSGYIFIYP